MMFRNVNHTVLLKTLPESTTNLIQWNVQPLQYIWLRYIEEV